MHGEDQRNFTTTTWSNTILILTALLILLDIRRCFQTFICHATWLTYTAIFAKVSLSKANKFAWNKLEHLEFFSTIRNITFAYQKLFLTHISCFSRAQVIWLWRWNSNVASRGKIWQVPLGIKEKSICK